MRRTRDERAEQRDAHSGADLPARAVPGLVVVIAAG
jgi:hypothetical protein